MQQIMRTTKKGPKAPNFIDKNEFYMQAAGIEKPTIPMDRDCTLMRTPGNASTQAASSIPEISILN